jgi:hypothetical protein
MKKRLIPESIRYPENLITCLIPLLLAFWLCSAGSMDAAAIDYGAENNPTGDPIGGGPGYSRIISAASANYVVTDKTGLINALNSATNGQIVYVDDNAEIDMTGSYNIRIASGVILASGRGRNGSDGALIYDARISSSSYYLFYVATGANTRITGLRIFGPDMDIGDRSIDPRGMSKAIHSNGTNLEVDNCELSGWSQAAIGLATAGNALIHHNYIHHNRHDGTNTGCGVLLHNAPVDALVEANLFDYNRNHIDGNGTAGQSYEARYNLCLEHGAAPAFVMNSTSTLYVAGDLVTIHQNTFRDRNQAGIIIRGVPEYDSPIYQNWFYHDLASNAVQQTNGSGNLDQHDNYLGTSVPSGTTLPTAVVQADVLTGVAPLTVNFNGSGSSAPGGSIIDYRWYFGDGSGAIGAAAKNAQASYTFNDPGKYNVVLQVRGADGVAARNVVPVTVVPSGSGSMLSFWVKDSYRDTDSGYFQKEVLIDGTVVWSDDVASNEGWQHVVADVSSRVSGKSQVTLTLRTRCSGSATTAQIANLYTYWDDVVLFGFDTANGGFESSSGWTYTVNNSSFTGQYFPGDLRSGYACYQMSYPPVACTAGYYAQISQTLNVSAPSVISYTPGGSSVSIDSSVTVGFSEAMNQSSVQSAFSISPSVAGNFSWSGNTLTFDPSSSLQFNTIYTVTVAAAAKDAGGTAMADAYSWQFTTVASTNALPTVLTRTPTGTAVSLDSSIAIGFSEAMSQSSAQSAFSISPSVAGSFSWSGNTLTFDPTSSLQYNTVYTVTVTTAAKDSDGAGMAAKYTWQFTTEVNTPPTVITKTPQGSTVSIDSSIAAGFSEAMNQSSAQSAFSISPAAAGSFSWDGNTLTFDPSSPLQYDTIYTVAITTAAKDLAGAGMAAKCTWQFTTEVNWPPAVVVKTPQGGDAPVGSVITAQFSEAMDQSAAESAFSLSPSVAGNFRWENTRLVFVPAEALQYATAYAVTITTIATDLSGLKMAAKYTWQFTTERSTPQITVAGPADGQPVFGATVIEAVVSDPVSIVKVDFYLDGSLVRTLTVPPYTWDWDPGSAAAGTHAIRITALNKDGGSSEKVITLKNVKAKKEVVYPNPYIKWRSVGGAKITFGNLPGGCTIRIYTVSEELVATIQHGQAADGGSEEWDISGVGGGIYIYAITDGGTTRTGKIGIIK